MPPDHHCLRWTVARTYADAPHEYVLRHQAPAAFDWYKHKIQSEGRREQFTLRGRTAIYRYYYAGDGYKYWIIRICSTALRLRRDRLAASRPCNSRPWLWGF